MEDKYRQILRQYWGYDDFRGIQREIIESIGSGKDTLGLMPTGGGKSVTFQVPALAEEGTCIVVTPLIALMKDQVQHLRKQGIKAAAIYSGMSQSEIGQVLDNTIFGGVKLLYVSPERLSSSLFLTKLKKINVSFITVDEAHCISQWGYDFRPSYLKIADIRKFKPDAPILALTATATPQVIVDIQDKLAFRKKNVFRMSFERKNLTYYVTYTDDKPGELLHLLIRIKGCAIVYVRSRRRCKEISEYLESNGISSTFYHAGLEHSERDLRQKIWQNNEKRVMVATNAFGMGIDKPDVRGVIHYDCPDSIEAYFQEAGRAGRDGEHSYAVLIWNKNEESKLRMRVDQTFPPKEFISNVYEHLAYYYEIGVGSGAGHTFNFDIGRFCITYHYYPILVDSALRILDNAGYLHYETDPNSRARLRILVGRNDLYRLDELSPDEDKVIMTLLRLYGGLFTDYEYIDESSVATMTGFGPHKTYQILKTLNAHHIVSFIPQRKMPFITYTRDREDEVFLPRSVYEDRKGQYIKRVEAVIAYASNKTVCRSRMLLRYFGEMESKDCGTCDVCIETAKSNIFPEKDTLNKILEVLGDKKTHDVKELMLVDAPSNDINRALRYLTYEELVDVDFGKIKLK